LTSATLSCTGVSKTFGGVRALNDIRLSFAAGQVTALIGPNGAGKTTLLNVFTGFVRPDRGRCFINSKDITHASPHRIAGFGVARTFQDVRLIRNLSVLENTMLAHPCQIGESAMRSVFRVGVARQEACIRATALEILEQLDLVDAAMKLAGELSYGQQKLLTLGACLATGASVLLLDEPFSGVAPLISKKLLDLLLTLRARQKTVLFIEHDVPAVLLAADRVVVMSQGSVLADGSPREVLSRRDVLEEYLA
jgi:ABC-type branched-subunit amino acid transport system ATPase component